MDHSIKDLQSEFLLMDDSFKISFLKNNSWLIATPLVIDNGRVFRFQQVCDAIEWLNTKSKRILKNMTIHSIKVPSNL
jgi:hypothetical protein